MREKDEKWRIKKERNCYRERERQEEKEEGWESSTDKEKKRPIGRKKREINLSLSERWRDKEKEVPEHGGKELLKGWLGEVNIGKWRQSMGSLQCKYVYQVADLP